MSETEVEFAGVKFRGGKIFIIITALSTLGGGLYAGFEFWKDYQDMKEQIESYVAPDLSEFDKRVSLLENKINSEIDLFKDEMKLLKSEVKNVVISNRELKIDTKQDIRRIETIVEDVEQRVKEDARETLKELKSIKTEVDDKIKRSLENPLNGMAIAK
jgi:DNA anti-recombination protein RmuC